MSYLARSKQTETRLRQESSPASQIEARGPTPGTEGLAQPPAAALKETVAALLDMSLDQFAQQAAWLEIRVPWHRGTFWFVPSGADAERLAREGVSRGRIWTAQELTSLLSIPNLVPESVRTVALAKVEFRGEVITVSEQSDRPSPKGAAGARACR